MVWSSEGSGEYLEGFWLVFGGDVWIWRVRRARSDGVCIFSQKAMCGEGPPSVSHRHGIFMPLHASMSIGYILTQTQISPNLLPIFSKRHLPSIKRLLFRLPIPSSSSSSPPPPPKHTAHKHKPHPTAPRPTPSSASHPAPHHNNASAPHLPF